MRKIVIEVPEDDCIVCPLIFYDIGWTCPFRPERSLVKLTQPVKACRDAEVSQ